MPHLLELFSGTGSMGRAFRAKGWQVTSVGIREDFHLSILCDVMELKVKMLGGLPSGPTVGKSPLHRMQLYSDKGEEAERPSGGGRDGV